MISIISQPKKNYHMSLGKSTSAVCVWRCGTGDFCQWRQRGRTNKDRVWCLLWSKMDVTPIGMKRYAPKKTGGFLDGGLTALSRALPTFDFNSEGWHICQFVLHEGVIWKNVSVLHSCGLICFCIVSHSCIYAQSFEFIRWEPRVYLWFFLQRPPEITGFDAKFWSFACLVV